MKLKSTFKQFDCCFFDVLSWINFCELWNTFLISSDNSHVLAPEQKVTWLFDSLNRISNNHEISVSRQNRCLVLHCGLIEFMMVKSAINVFVNTRASRLTGHLIDHSEVRSSIRGRFSGWPGMLTYPKRLQFPCQPFYIKHSLCCIGNELRVTIGCHHCSPRFSRTKNKLYLSRNLIIMATMANRGPWV